ncbi:MAG: hypothetical protein ACREID_07635 [Planctomycetota bacterium]
MRTCTILLAAAAAVAAAAESYSDAKEAYERAVQSKETDVIAGAVGRLARAAAKARDDEKREARLILGKHLSDRRRKVVVAAVSAYGDLRLEGSSRDLWFLVKSSRNRYAPHDLKLVAIEAYGRIHDAGAHVDLLEYIRVPSHLPERMDLARAAARALASFKDADPRHRYRLLEDVMQAFDAIHNTIAVTASSTNIRWFTGLEREMVASFNAIAKARAKDYDECREWWRDNRGAVKAGRR